MAQVTDLLHINTLWWDKGIARIYWDSVWEEFRVKFWQGDQYLKDANYHTTELDDAIDTAFAELKRMKHARST